MYIKPKAVIGLILSTLCIISLSIRCDAQLYFVEFNDPDGPHWTGIVDTSRDQLNIETWTENPGGMSFWTQQDLPADWNARTVVNSANTRFDIPLNWDGTIDDNWGFTPFNNIAQLNWNEGVYTELGIATGWGAGCGTISSLDTSGSESDMFCLPTSESTVGDAVGTATVTDLQTRFSVVSGDFFAPGNWDNGTPGPTTNAVIANGGTATATTGSLQLLQATVGDMRNGGDGTLESNGVSIDIERDLVIASLVRDAAIGDQTCNGILTVCNADLFEVGDQARFETLVSNTIGGGDQVLAATGSLSLENVATVNMGTLEAGGTDEPMNATYGNSNQTTDADVSITNAENVSIFEDLELAKTRRGNSEANATLNTNADLLISNISGNLFIGEDFEVANNGLDGGYAGTASCTATAILNNIGTVSIGCDFDIGFYSVSSNTQSVPSSITVNGSAEVRDVTNLSVADNLDVAFLRTDSDNNVFAGTTMSSIGSLVLDNVAEFAVDDRTRIGVHNDADSAMPTTGADIEVDGQLKMTATSFATASLEVGEKRMGTESMVSGLVELNSSHLVTEFLSLGESGDLRFQLQGTNRITTSTVGEPGTYSTLVAAEATLGGEIIAEFDFVPSAGTHVFDLIITDSITALDDSTMAADDFQVVGLNPGFTIDSFGVIEDGVDIVRLQISGVPVLFGDVNLDGAVNLLDVGPLVDLINNGLFQIEGDINQDGFVNLSDVYPFINILSGG